MSISNLVQSRMAVLKREYDGLKREKDALLKIIDEAEISESVYNSNAIENSTLTLAETEKILLEMEVSKNISVREIFEAKNLASVIEYIRRKSQEEELSKERILLLHKMLIGDIEEGIAGRFRANQEYVRIGTHIAPPPERLNKLIEEILLDYSSDYRSYFADKIVRFHLELEIIHPFNDGNGRIGRAIINYQLQRLGFPSIIVRDKEKKAYYQAFIEYRDKKQTKLLEKVISLAIMESLHKRIAYLKGGQIIALADYAKKQNYSVHSLLNAARRQTIPAFREKGIWKIEGNYPIRKIKWEMAV